MKCRRSFDRGRSAPTLLTSANPPCGGAHRSSLIRPRPPPGRGNEESPCLWPPSTAAPPRGRRDPDAVAGPAAAQRARPPAREPVLLRRHARASPVRSPSAAGPGRGSSGSSPPARSPTATGRAGRWWPGLAYSGLQGVGAARSEVEPGWVLTANYQRWLLQRRMRTSRQVHEVMTEFWEHHLHVPANGEPSFVYRKRYGDTIRAQRAGHVRGDARRPRSCTRRC